MLPQPKSYTVCCYPDFHDKELKMLLAAKKQCHSILHCTIFAFLFVVDELIKNIRSFSAIESNSPGTSIFIL